MSKAEKEAVKKMKASAYKSMLLGKLGMTEKTPKKTENLKRWNQMEEWVNLTALLTDKKELPCGTKGKKQKEKSLPSVCRPKKKANNATPKPLAGDLTKKQIEKAIKIKQKGQQIYWSKL